MKTRFLMLLVIFYFTNSQSQVTYVKKDAGGLNNGTSWENAYTDLDYAIENTEIGALWVANGVYFPATDLQGNVPTNETLKTFRLKKDIAIYGGFDGNETDLDQRNWGSNQTILSGELGVENDVTDNARHVVSSEYVDLNENTILDGLTIRDGFTSSQNDGAGIYVNQTYGGQFIVRNCTIENNFSFGDGGGLYVFNCNPIIENNVFQENKAFRGGAIYLYYSDALVKENMIINNTVDNYVTVGSSSLSGGGIYVSYYSSPIIVNNLIKGNFARYEGGGVTIDNNYHIIFEGNLVIENTSDNGGGLHLNMSEGYFFNNIIAKNVAMENGGAIYMDYNPEGPDFINNTITENTAELAGGGLYLIESNINIVNSIISKNSPANNQIRAINSGNWAPQIRYCNIENGENGIVSTNNEITYENNIEGLPMFINSNEDDFGLQAESTLIDAGTTDSEIFPSQWTGSNSQIIDFPSTDYLGNPRIISTIDIGAYEFDPAIGLPTIDEFPNLVFYPNPSEGTFNFNANLNFDSITIYDIHGRKLKSINKETNVSSFNLSTYDNGVYIGIIRFGEDQQQHKIILNK